MADATLNMPVQAPAQEAETIRRALMFGLENGGETDFNHQRRQKGDDEYPYIKGG